MGERGFAAVVFGSLLVVGCFKGDFLSGVPCQTNDECGPGLSCENGACGGTSGVTNAETSMGPTSTTNGESSTTLPTDPSTSTTDPSTSTTDPSTSTTDPTTSSESSTTEVCGTGVFCCDPPTYDSCDSQSNQIGQAMELCPAEFTVSSTASGATTASSVKTGFGPTTTFDPQEGTKYAVLSTGSVGALDMVGFCSTNHPAQFDPGPTLPAPIVPDDADGNCWVNPEFVDDAKDCSRSIQSSFDPINNPMALANDYVELRVTATVPDGANSFSFDFSFLSTEYPMWVNSGYNDLFIAWLDSELWTGNVTYNTVMSSNLAMSVNSNLFSIVDDAMNHPAFVGTCMVGHGATDWLETTAPVQPGEQIELVFAVFDSLDGSLDSVVFLDDFQWGCGGDSPPSTILAP